jgi:hypothetical protein
MMPLAMANAAVALLNRKTTAFVAGRWIKTAPPVPIDRQVGD